MNCSRCQDAAVVVYRKVRLCAKHHRFSQMRSTARKHGKEIPTYEQLESLLSATAGMVCKDCGRKMNWLRTDTASISTQITFQHYRSGSMALICLACNTRHAKMPGDDYLALPKGHKRCPKCGAVKPLTEFGKGGFNKGVARIRPYCRQCVSAVGASAQRVAHRSGCDDSRCRGGCLPVEQRTVYGAARARVVITHAGESLSVSEWAKRFGLTYNALRIRLRSGWPLERALAKPEKRRARIAKVRN